MKTQNLMKNKGISAVNYIKKKEKNVMKGLIQIMPLNITNSGKLLKHFCPTKLPLFEKYHW